MSELSTPTAEKSPGRTSPEEVGSLLDDWLMGRMSERCIGKENQRHREHFEQAVRTVARELAGPSPTPIEWTLAMTAAVCWAELRFLQGCEQSSGEGTIAQADLAQRRIDKAHRR